MFGFCFKGKQNNRKFMTDYNLKMYPMLKSNPSIGFSELVQSGEGSFTHRPVRAFGLTLG